MSHGCRALEAEDRLPPPRHRVGLQRRSPADRRQVRRARGRLVAGCAARELHHVRSLARARARPAPPDDAAGWVEAQRAGASVVGARARARRERRADAGRRGAFAALLAYGLAGAAEDEAARRASTPPRARRAFTTAVGRAYLRELSIDELPGPDDAGDDGDHAGAVRGARACRSISSRRPSASRRTCRSPTTPRCAALIEKQWDVCAQFGVSIGFHSGSGKSAENYQVMRRRSPAAGSRSRRAAATPTRWARALFASKNAADQALWRDWYKFTLRAGARSARSAPTRPNRRWRAVHRRCARARRARRRCLRDARRVRARRSRRWRRARTTCSGSSTISCIVLAGGGRADKAALGDHTPAGYRQRARFYAISDEGRLRYAQDVARYICFLAETTGLAPAAALRARRGAARRLHALRRPARRHRPRVIRQARAASGPSVRTADLAALLAPGRPGSQAGRGYRAAPSSIPGVLDLGRLDSPP